MVPCSLTLCNVLRKAAHSSLALAARYGEVLSMLANALLLYGGLGLLSGHPFGHKLDECTAQLYKR